jgi:glutathione synthase/RimK-type ligase-like ATP-grasp enzyme
MKIILVEKYGKPSTKKIYEQIITPNSNLVHICNNGLIREYSQSGKKVIRKKLSEYNTVIKWGCTKKVKANVIYNKTNAIIDSSNKGEARLIMQEAGVRVPKFIHIENYKDEDCPIIARPNHHAKGKNFVTFNKEQFEEFAIHYRTHNGNWYYSSFVDKDREFRVHCAHGKILGIVEKPNPKNGSLAWNMAQTHEPFKVLPRSEWKKMLCWYALKAVKSLNLDFGAVDVIKKGNTYYVLEVNTAPDIASTDYMTGKYAQYFNWLLAKDHKRPHWDFDSYENTDSYSWKNFQFKDEHKEDSSKSL